MKLLAKTIGTCILLAVLVWFGTVLADRQHLNEDLIRLHVVAESDSEADQQIKLRVRDAVNAYLRSNMDAGMDTEQAKQWLQAHLQEISEAANAALDVYDLGVTATVSLKKEAFPTRDYDTFTLPAGVYESLRVTIGEGEGKNWWCVVFPSLCIPATTEGFEAAAAGSGFPDSLTGALTEEEPYQIRFFVLDCLGWLENFLFRG